MVNMLNCGTHTYTCTNEESLQRAVHMLNEAYNSHTCSVQHVHVLTIQATGSICHQLEARQAK